MTGSEDLRGLAKSVRKKIIEMIGRAGSGHPGGSLSIVEILVYLYYRELRIDPKHPAREERDRLVLSKGHGAPALYAVLAMKGFFPLSELYTLRSPGSILQGHPDMRRLVLPDNWPESVYPLRKDFSHR